MMTKLDLTKKYPGLSMEEVSLKVPRSSWSYRLMIRMPEWVTKAAMDQSIQQVSEKKGVPEVGKVEWFEMEEGKAVQILHVGPFSTELESLLKIQAYMKENGLVKNGLHHEIYLSDFRKTTPEKLKTILREPVK